MRRLIELDFELRINEMFKGRENIIKFLLRHNKRNLLFDNLAKELTKVDKLPFMTKETMYQVISDFTSMFARSALLSKEQDLLSLAERSRQENEFRAAEDFKKELNKETDAKADTSGINA
jgi:hypothetical protein